MADPLNGGRIRGMAYIFHNGIMMFGFLYIIRKSLSSIKLLRGLRRIEMRFIVLTFSCSLFLSFALIASGNIFESVTLRRIGIIMSLLMYAISGWTLLSPNTVEIKYIIISLLFTITLALLLFTSTYLLWLMSRRPTTSPIEIAIAFALLAAATIKVESGFKALRARESERLWGEARLEIITLARKSLSAYEIQSKFEHYLMSISTSPLCAFLKDRGKAYMGSSVEVKKDSRVFTGLCDLIWATPESLQGRPSSEDILALETFLEENNLGLMMAVPRRSPSPSMLVTFRSKLNERPFSESEVNRLQSIAELMDNILTHAHLAAQAALQAKLEHLAFMSRGLAHDLKNLITPVSSFLIHTDGHYPPESPAGEVHALARRSVSIMTEYVREALFFADQLQPKIEQFNVSNLLMAVCEITAERAKSRQVCVVTQFGELAPCRADRVLMQRVLANLVQNAIDASRPGQTVSIFASSPSEGLELQVVDHGCGIPPENLSKIFDPYFTTKQFGDEVRGFGLGLTICQKIVSLHGGTISVSSRPAEGTTFRVRLPFDSNGHESPATGLDSPLRATKVEAPV